jgi:hypothetical protein
MNLRIADAYLQILVVPIEFPHEQRTAMSAVQRYGHTSLPLLDFGIVSTSPFDTFRLPATYNEDSRGAR